MTGPKDKKGTMTEILRFAITGGFCFVIEFAVLTLLHGVIGIDTLIATPIAFTVSVIVNYILCVLWVFKAAGDEGNTTKISFFITSLIGLALNEVLMLIFRHAFGEEKVFLTIFGTEIRMYMVNKAMATLIVMAWNYFTKKAILTSEKLKGFLRKK